MANLAVLASGNGSNFQALAEAIKETDHRVCCLICDIKDAYVFVRASSLNIKSDFISYHGKNKKSVESRIIEMLHACNTDLIALAGFMRLISPHMLSAFPDKIINIHPSLLPAYPGTHAIEKSYKSDDKKLGITIHRVDKGMDTGPVLLQKYFYRTGKESIKEVEEKIHQLEHEYYPGLIISLLNAINS